MLDQPYSAIAGRLRSVSTAAKLINAIDDAPSVRAFFPVASALRARLTAEC